MYIHQTIKLSEKTVEIFLRNGTVERHEFSTSEEAERRVRFIEEGMTWRGTPFRDNAEVKGLNGAVDCAMFLRRSAIDSKLIADFPKPHYPPRWHMHRDEQRFVNFLLEMGAVETDTPKIGDVHMYFWGRCYAHGAIRINNKEILHAYGPAGMCLVSNKEEPLLRYMTKKLNRPVRYFDVWSR